MSDLVSVTHGVLYACCDPQVSYVGQTKSKKKARHSDDTVVKYRNENNIQHQMLKIPLSIVPLKLLGQMEQGLIFCNNLAYLLGFIINLIPNSPTLLPQSTA